MEMVAAPGQLAGLEIVEINPIRDVANRTGQLANSLILAALGGQSVELGRLSICSGQTKGSAR